MTSYQRWLKYRHRTRWLRGWRGYVVSVAWVVAWCALMGALRAVFDVLGY